MAAEASAVTCALAVLWAIVCCRIASARGAAAAGVHFRCMLSASNAFAKQQNEKQTAAAFTSACKQTPCAATGPADEEHQGSSAIVNMRCNVGARKGGQGWKRKC